MDTIVTGWRRAASAETGAFAGTEAATGCDHCASAIGQGVGTIAICTANTVPIAVTNGEGVIASAEADAFGNGRAIGLPAVSATGSYRSTTGIGNGPGSFCRIVIERDGQSQVGVITGAWCTAGTAAIHAGLVAILNAIIAGRRNGRAAGCGVQQAGTGATGLKQGPHTCSLALREEVHTAIIGIVHVVLEHIRQVTGPFITGVIAGEITRRTRVVWPASPWRIADEVIGITVAITPDVAKVEVVPHLVRTGPALIERCGSGANIPEVLVVYNHSIGTGRATRELGVTQNAAANITNPKVHVITCRPGVFSTAGVELHFVIGTKGGDTGGRARNAIGWVALRVNGSQAKLNFHIGCYALKYRRRVDCIRIQPAEVLIQDVNLALHLSRADILGGIVVYHMYHHGYGNGACHRP